MSDFNRFFLFVLLCLFATQTLACATVFTGSSDTIQIKSEPRGAKVLIEGIERGRTPLTVPVSRDAFNDTMVTLELEGYESRTFVLQQDFNGVYIVNILFFPGFLIDMATGAMMKYTPRNYTVSLEPEPGAAPPPALPAP